MSNFLPASHLCDTCARDGVSRPIEPTAPVTSCVEHQARALPNVEALASGAISGYFRDWPRLRSEAKALLSDRAVLARQLAVSQQQLEVATERLRTAYSNHLAAIEARRQSVALLEDARKALGAAEADAGNHLALIDTLADQLRHFHRECQVPSCGTCAVLEQAREVVE